MVPYVLSNLISNSRSNENLVNKIIGDVNKIKDYNDYMLYVKQQVYVKTTAILVAK